MGEPPETGDSSNEVSLSKQSDDTPAIEDAVVAEGDDVEATEADESEEVADEGETPVERGGRPNPFARLSHVGRALVTSGLVVAALAGLTGWLGFRAYQQHQAQAQRDLFIQTARQGG